MENPQARCSPLFGRYTFDPSPSSSSQNGAIACPTPPIAVPRHQNVGGPGAGGSYAEQAPRRRHKSISFDPQVKLDGGMESALEAPLPRCTGHFGTMTEAERHSFESDFVGLEQDPLMPGSPPQALGRQTGRRRSTAAQRLLSPSSSEVGISSLTSESTMSSASELETPPNSLIGRYFGRGPIRSPAAASSRPISLSPGATSPFFSVENKENPPNEPFSFEAARASRSRSARRRTCSERSPNSCSSNGISPASMFLSSFGKASSRRPSMQQVSPDDEGQEVGSYVLGKDIGHGGFSTVKEAFTFAGGCEVRHAVKIVRKRVHQDDAENDKVQAELDHEISLWRYLHHPHIVSLISVFDTPFATFAFMPLNEDGSLFDLVRQQSNRRGLPAEQARRFAFQLACALRYLHEDMRIVHGDVKLENCLLENPSSPSGRLLLCDFGLAKFMKNPHDDDDDDDPLPSIRSTADAGSYCITGSLPYAAPEIVESSAAAEAPSPTADVWALGVVVFTMLTGTLPFTHSLQPKLAAMIVEGNFDVAALRDCWGLKEAGKAQMEMAVELVKGCLTVDPERRWNIHDVLESAWFEGLEMERGNE